MYSWVYFFFNLDLLNFDCDPEFPIRKAASSLACTGSDAEGYRASPPAPIQHRLLGLERLDQYANSASVSSFASGNVPQERSL